MATMIRKQVYLEPRQDVQIKRLAAERGTTEAEIIREAVDLLLSESQRLLRAQSAWDAAGALMETRVAYGMTDEAREEKTRTRDEFYEKRREDYGQDTDCHEHPGYAYNQRAPIKQRRAIEVMSRLREEQTELCPTFA